MSRLAQRRVALTVDTLRVVDLDLAFRVERDLKPEPNKAEIDVYNLAPSNRKKLEGLGNEAQVVLSVGYGSGMSTIFRGDLKSALTMRDGTDLVTQIRAGDGQRARQTARVSRSFAPGTTVETVLRALTEELGVDSPAAAELARAVLETGRASFDGGISLSGDVASELTALTASSGLEWSIQDGRLQLLRRGQGLRHQAILLSPGTGLIDTPEIDDSGMLKARTLIIPDITPGVRVRVDAEHVSGVFRVERTMHTGETSGEDWTIEIDAKPEVST